MRGGVPHADRSLPARSPRTDFDPEEFANDALQQQLDKVTKDFFTQLESQQDGPRHPPTIELFNLEKALEGIDLDSVLADCESGKRMPDPCPMQPESRGLPVGTEHSGSRTGSCVGLGPGPGTGQRSERFGDKRHFSACPKRGIHAGHLFCMSANVHSPFTRAGIRPRGCRGCERT